MQFTKHQLRMFPHLLPRPLLLPREAKGSNESQGKSTNVSRKGTAFVASLHEPFDQHTAPLLRLAPLLPRAGARGGGDEGAKSIRLR
jgi:hypothetical protein